MYISIHLYLYIYIYTCNLFMIHKLIDHCNEAIKVELGDLGNCEWNSIKRVSIVETTCFRSMDRIRRYSKFYL